MGTNFYLDIPYDGPHIGKASAGWVFGFEATTVHNVRTTKTHHPRSWAEWRELLEESPQRDIVDEYGRTYTLDEFTDIVTRRSPARSRETLMTMAQWFAARGYPPSDDHWSDAEGYDFTGTPFS